jgi:hypothetical protein
MDTIDLNTPDGRDLFKRTSGGFAPKGNARPAHTPGEMNKLEAAMDCELDALKRGGQILAYYFEAVTLKLAKRTHYRPDFFILWSDGSIEVRECKGHWEDDARAKIKIAADKFRCFKFTAYTKAKGGGWNVEEIVP